MKIKMGCLLLALFLMAVNPLRVYAEDYTGGDGWSVRFDGEQMTSTFEDKEIVDAVYRLEPGDTVELHISLDNQSKETTDWYMTNEVLNSLEDKSAANGGAYSYILTYTNSKGEATLLYKSENIGGESAEGKKGLHQAADAMDSYFYLDRLSGGTHGEITLQVGLEGESQGNAYQNTLAKLQMNFAVELVTNPTSEPPKTPGPHTFKTPKTGDDTRQVLFVSLTLIAGLVCVVVVILRIREQRRSDGTRPRDKRRK